MKWSRCALLVVAFVGSTCGGKQDPGDGGSSSDAGGDGNVCSYQETRTTMDRTCSTAAECIVVVRSVSCCQEQHEGIRKDAAMKFQSQQAALTAGCPGCGCNAQPIDDTGQKGNATFTVTCDNALCTSHAQ